MEKWKDIPEYEGLYQASNLGRIRTAEGKTTYTQRHGARHWKQRILKQKNDKSNCLRVTLWKGGKSKDFLVARLICTTWHENLINTDLTVNHIDGNRLNNNADNLEWLTRKDNILHGFATGLYDGISTKVKLKDTNTSEVMSFRSLSKASTAIGRNHGYLSCCLQRDKLAVSADGRRYQIIKAG